MRRAPGLGRLLQRRHLDSLVRNSKYLHLPKHKLNSGMSGSERLRVLKGIEVLM
ncbi:hypothetical protein FOXYSP1_12936 [Fusarium oxysporum f. sp. phaseoli]